MDLDSSTTNAYFSSMSTLAGEMMKEKNVLAESLDSQVDADEMEEIIDDTFMSKSIADSYLSRYIIYTIPPQYPKPDLGSGEKVMVDFENEGWCWQDEHSGPFSWETRSQLDGSTGVERPSTPKFKRLSNPPTKPMRPPSVEESDMFKSIWQSPFLQADVDQPSDALNMVFGNRNSRVELSTEAVIETVSASIGNSEKQREPAHDGKQPERGDEWSRSHLALEIDDTSRGDHTILQPSDTSSGALSVLEPDDTSSAGQTELEETFLSRSNDQSHCDVRDSEIPPRDLPKSLSTALPLKSMVEHNQSLPSDGQEVASISEPPPTAKPRTKRGRRSVTSSTSADVTSCSSADFPTADTVEAQSGRAQDASSMDTTSNEPTTDTEKLMEKNRDAAIELGQENAAFIADFTNKCTAKPEIKEQAVQESEKEPVAQFTGFDFLDNW